MTGQEFRKAALLVIALLAASCERGASAPDPSVPTDLSPAQVTHVIDGDTIRVLIEGEEYRLRYIGIDSPEVVEPVECLGAEAGDRNRELLEGQAIGLEKDVSETDAFGRLLRYVWVEGRMVNAELVKDGYALAKVYPPDVKYSDLLAGIQAEAREAGRGLWSDACETRAP